VKIIQILPELNEGGVERGTLESSREYIKLGNTSIVISAGGKLVNEIENDGAKHIQLDVCSKNIFTFYFRMLKLRKILKKLKPDIIHVRSRVPAWLTYIANKTLGFNFVTTIHGLNSINKYSEIMTKGDRVIAVGEVVKEHVVNGYNIDPNKVTIIQRGVDTNKFSPLSVDNKFIQEFKKEYNLDDKYIVTSVGRITWLKDYETFIKSIALAKDHIPNITAVIAGGVREDKENYFQSLKDLAIRYNVEDRVHFVGSQSEIAEIYYLSDVLVNASLKMGNVARTIIEAFAMNTPVLATTYEGLNDLVENDKNGYIIKTQDEKDLAEKIILTHNKNFTNIRENLNQEYTLNTMINNTIKIYEELN
jgi:glycosyltransferase involved in cell wall biosynthesis